MSAPKVTLYSPSPPEFPYRYHTRNQIFFPSQDLISEIYDSFALTLNSAAINA